MRHTFFVCGNNDNLLAGRDRSGEEKQKEQAARKGVSEREREMRKLPSTGDENLKKKMTLIENLTEIYH